MALQTADVLRRVDALAEHYERKGYDQALAKLIETLDIVADVLNRPGMPSGTRAYPANYQSMAKLGISWFKVNAYWIGYVPYRGQWLLTNFFYESNDMSNRVLTDLGVILPL